MELAVTEEVHEAGLRSFETFFEEEYRRLVRTLYLLVGDVEKAEEIAQAAMVRVFERWDRVRRSQSPTGYLYRVALNLNRRRVRSMIRSARLPPAAGDEGPDPARVAAASIDTRRVLASLPQRYREILVLAEWLELDHRELAELLRISPTNARVRLHRAREAFRARLGDGYG